MQAYEMRPLADFIRDHGVSMRCEQVADNPHMTDDRWKREASHWRCVLRCGGRQLTVYFSQGAAHTEPPIVASVLGCLAMDAAGVENASGFWDWCSEYGYDDETALDMRHTYDVIKRQAAGLERLLGGSAPFLALLNDTDHE